MSRADSYYLAMGTRTGLAASLVLLGVACTTGPRDSALVISTDASTYPLDTAGAVIVHATAVNRGSVPLFIAGCTAPAWNLEVRDSAGQWVDPLTVTCTINNGSVSGVGSGDALFRLEPDSAIATTVPVTGTGSAPDTLRLVLSYATDSGVLPNRQGNSHAFVIEGR